MKSSFNEAVLRSLIMISNACMVLDILDVINAVPLSFGMSSGFQEDLVHVFLCKLLPFSAYLSMGASVLTLTVMTIDLYLVIVRPMRRPLSKQLTMVPILLKWLISDVIFAAELYKFRLFKDSGQDARAPRWVENNRHDRPRLPCSRWSFGSCCYTWFR